MKIDWQKSLLIYAIIIVVAIVLFSILLPGSNQPEELPISEVVALSQDGAIEKIAVEGDVLRIITRDGTEYISHKEPGTSIYDVGGLDLQAVEVEVTPPGFDWGGLFINLVPILIFGALLFFMFSWARGANSQAMSFGQSRAKLVSPSMPKVTFNDVAGADEAKQEVYEVVEFLKHRDRFQSLGARVPRGILLVGPPGTGKTLLAKAIAGEAGTPFYSISGSEFVEMFVGVGASRVRDLFDQAKRNSPSIIFIDEIDAVGRQRGAGLGGGHDEREQTLNQILVEMDGFATDTNVVVIAATNRPDILDPALLRPGRFDRRVVIDLPDMIGRKAILEIHTRGKPLGTSVNLESLAKETVGFSGADLANVVNEAAILAARRRHKAIENEDLEEAIERVIAGPERRSRKISPHEKEVSAYHEAGHALVARLLPNADPVHKISVVARGLSLGYTLQLPSEDRYLLTFTQYQSRLATLLGGRVAEELVYGEISTGAAQDIKEATQIAHRMVTEYGMSERLGPRTFGNRQDMVFLGREIAEQRDYGDKVADLIDDEVDELLRQALATARKLLEVNRPRLDYIASRLVADETLEGEKLEETFTCPIDGKGSMIEKKTRRNKRVPKIGGATEVLLPQQNPA